MSLGNFANDGAAALDEIPGTLKEISTRTGVSISVLSRLRNGEQPSKRVAENLEEKLGIARDAWKRGAPVPEEPGPAGGASAGVSDDASPRGHLTVARRWREWLQSQGAPARDVTAALEAERRAVELVRKASEEDAEEIIAEILSALEPFPEAREAVARVLEAR